MSTVIDRDDIEADFRRVMASVVEQACAEGLELDVMEAVAPVLVPGMGADDEAATMTAGSIGCDGKA
jgi:hypothetical protein